MEDKNKCCSTQKEENKNKSFGSANKEKKAEVASCCHHKEEKAEVASCCHHKEEKTEVASCCHHIEEKNVKSCCHSHNEMDACDLKDEKTDNCCGGKAVDINNKLEINKKLIFLALSLGALIVSFISPFHDYGKVARLLDFAFIPIILCGVPIYKAAIKTVSKKKITSSLLVSIAITASITMGVLAVFSVVSESHGHSENYFFAAGEVAFLMALGELIESVTVGKSRSAVNSLLKIKPNIALLKIKNGYSEIDVKNININDIVLIKPNETVSVDGEIISGSASLNEANITGESTPVDKSAGEIVYAGTTNLDKAFEVKVTKRNNETTLSKLISYVQTAEKNKAPIVKQADKWASYLVPSACLISIIVFIVSFFWIKAEVVDSLNRAITILVVVCPCALALATPVAISAAIGNLSKNGILVKSGIALEALAKVDTVAFDKTGTLTSGKLKVEKIHSLKMSKDELIYYAASAEMQSEHPIARAIVNHANGNLTSPTKTVSQSGVGVTSIVDKKEIKLVKATSLDSISISEFGVNSANSLTAVIIDNQLEGLIEISDTVREGAADAISQLKGMKINSVMLTGDNENSARNVAEKIMLTNYYANLLPEDKVKHVERLKSVGRKVLMTGDGINDAPALATSDCSVAMGAMGNSVAIDTADISLMKNEISKIPYLIKLAKRTFITIKGNIILSLSISITAVFLSMFGLLNVVGGALVHNIGSVLVSLNAALLLLYGRKRFTIDN